MSDDYKKSAHKQSKYEACKNAILRYCDPNLVWEYKNQWGKNITTCREHAEDMCGNEKKDIDHEEEDDDKIEDNCKNIQLHDLQLRQYTHIDRWYN